MDVRGRVRRAGGLALHRIESIAPELGRRFRQSRVAALARRWVGAAPRTAGPAGRRDIYEDLYEQHGRTLSATTSIGDGEFDLIGAIELALLRQEGLRPGDRVVDFGCGTGRLAVHLVPALEGGSYVGIDIAPSMLARAEALVRERVPAPRCTIEWVHQTKTRFELPDDSADLMCAFSVFTHMEHEDTYRYLVDARRVVRPGGKFLLSCLPMDLEVARRIFRDSASRDVAERWSTVRNVTTSRDFMDVIATEAGWSVSRWYRGDEASVDVAGRGRLALGQSTCVLVRGEAR